MKKFMPDAYKKNIYEINYKKLKEKGIKYLFFDLDNTLIPYTESIPTEDNIKLFKKLKKDGFKCFLFSNSHGERLKPFKDALDIDIYTSSMKPLKKNYKKVLLKYKKEECAFIGDQLMTDVLGAKRQGFYVILVDRIFKKEPIYTKFWRFFERFILLNLKRKDKLVKGRYYD